MTGRKTSGAHIFLGACRIPQQDRSAARDFSPKTASQHLATERAQTLICRGSARSRSRFWVNGMEKWDQSSSETRARVRNSLNYGVCDDVRRTQSDLRPTSDSRIKGNPNRIIMTNGDGRIIYMATGLVRGKCNKCAKVMYVESNEGVMCCCGCGAPFEDIVWAWGNTKIVFVPEE